MNSTSAPYRENDCAPSLGFPLVVCLVVTILISLLQLVVFHDRMLPLGAGLPLLICLWNRDLRLLYGMAAAFTWVAVVKILWVMPAEMLDPSSGRTLITSHMLNIWLVAGVLHGLIRTRATAERKSQELDRLKNQLAVSNKQLAAINMELTARKEEITHPDEELQGRAQGPQQQAGDMQRSFGQKQPRSAELLPVDIEQMRKDRGLRTLLDSGRWMRANMNESLVMNGICQAAVQMLGAGVQAAAVAVDRHGLLGFKGDFGVDLHAAPSPGIAFEKTFTFRTLQAGQTFGIEDVAGWPDLELPPAAAGPPFRGALGSPIRVAAKTVGTLEVYRVDPQPWQEQDFRLVQWLANQAAIALHAMRAHHELERRRRAAEETSLQKTRFFAAVSHDVRTPAHAISLLAEVIEKCANDPQNCHRIPALAKNLWSNARAMVDLLSGVLEITRFDTGDFNLHITEFPLIELLRTEIRQALPFAESKSLKLCLDCPDHELWLASDRMKLARVLSNLICNAIKFTATGDVKIECLAADDGGVRIHVTDTGIGIPSKQLGNVFNEFMQLRSPDPNGENGTGLGLAICRRLSHVLGFRIQVQSVLGKGSTFTIEIPSSCVVAAKDPGKLSTTRLEVTPER